MIKMSELIAQMNSMLQGIQTDDLEISDRKVVMREALSSHNRNAPKREVIEIPGNASGYYMLNGEVVVAQPSNRDAGIDLVSSGADEQLAFSFTLDYEMEIMEVEIWATRTGTPDGDLQAHIYNTATDLPDQEIVASNYLDIDGLLGPRAGWFGRVVFSFPIARRIPAGVYQLVISSRDYEYSDGTEEVVIGVDQSDITNDTSTFNGSVWAAYGTDSAGIFTIRARVPGWFEGFSTLKSVEYPAADPDQNETPQMLPDGEFGIFETTRGYWLRLPVHSPSVTENLRVIYSSPYVWIEGDDPLVSLPETMVEPLVLLSCAISCEVLAVRFGQKSAPSLAADVIERRTMADQYLTIAKRFRENYNARVLASKDDSTPGIVLTDIDYFPEPGGDFLFHQKSRR